MTLHELKVEVALGEESHRQFKLARGVSTEGKFGENFRVN
jgi:hypothetical protein